MDGNPLIDLSSLGERVSVQDGCPGMKNSCPLVAVAKSISGKTALELE